MLSSGQVLLKRGLGSGEGLVWPLLIAGFFAYGIAGVLVTVALKFGDLSVLYPFIALGFVWVTLASIWLLSERLLWTQVLGVVVIISGVSLVGRGAK